LARHREAVCRLCRREGQKLFLKGLRCFTEKCAIEKRNFVPGQHGQSRRVKKLAENLIVMLERRLDNAVWRAGFASSRSQARQIVLHGHILINGKKVNIPSYLVGVGEEITLKDKMHQNAMVLEARNVAQSQNAVPWLEIDRDTFKAKVAALPKRENVTTPPITEQLIVELYSK
jgi:small subunit ribosomal protein S4